jgi:thioredoxin 2
VSGAVTPCPACGKKNRVPMVARGTPACGTCHQPLPWLVEAGASDFEAALGAPVPVLVDLWAPWCGPCRMVAPVVEEAAREFAGHLKVVKVNVDEAPQVSTRFGVQGIPTLLVLRQGHVVAEQVGALSREALLSWVRKETGQGAVR